MSKRDAEPDPSDSGWDVLDALGIGRWILDLTTGVFQASEQARELHGVSPGEPLTEAAAAERIHPEDRERVQGALQATIERGEPFDEEHRVRGRDGAVHWLMARARRVDGPLRVVGYVQDITARKVAEEEREQERRRLDAVLEALPTGVIIAEPDGKMTRWNRSAERIWGGPLPGADRLEEYGRYPAHWPESGKRVEPEEWPLVRASKGETVEGELVEIHAYDGMRRLLLMSAAPVRMGEGELAGAVTAAVDVTRTREAERRLALALEVAGLGVFEWDLRRDRVHYENRRMWEIMGARPGEYLPGLGRLLEALVPSEDRERLTWELERAMERGSLQSRYRVRGRDGQERVLEGTVRVIRDEEGPARVVGVASDVTDAVRAQEALRESEEQLRLTFDQAAVGIVQAKADGTIVRVNQGFAQLLGYDPEQLVGQNVFDLTHPDDQRADRAMAQAVAAGEQDGYTIEKRYLHREGHVVWTRMTSSAIRNGEGEPILAVGIVEDLTERQTAEARNQALAEAMPLLAWTADPRGRVEYVNARFAEYTGLSRDALDRTTEPIHPDDLPRVRETWIEALAAGRPWEEELRLRGRDGEYRWFLSRCVPLAGSDGPLGWIGVSTDIHDQKEAEAVLDRRVRERTAALERANEELDGFMYTVSHDLRAPLRAIVSMSQMLDEDYAEALPPDAREMLDRQKASALRLGTLIDELLQLSRLSRRELQRAPLDLTALVRSVAQELEAGSPGGPMVRVDEGMKTTADSTLTRLLVQNLLENARKFSPQSGEIHVGCEETERGPAFFVRDQGIGFDMRFAHKLFLPFERLVLEREYAGTGIGLANVKRIVDRHGGDVWAYGEPGNGATFFFRLEPKT